MCILTLMADKWTITMCSVEENLKQLDEIKKQLDAEYAKIRADVLNGEFDNLMSFYDTTGKGFGTRIERMICNYFPDLEKVTAKNNPTDTESKYFDAFSKDGKRIEIKASRILSDESNELKFFTRAVAEDEEKPPKNISFQQVKPKYCDWFIFIAEYKNSSRVFFCPSHLIQEFTGDEYRQEGKLYMGNQHPGATNKSNKKEEGAITFGEVLKFRDIIEVPPVKSFEEGIKIVEERLAKI